MSGALAGSLTSSSQAYCWSAMMIWYHVPFRMSMCALPLVLVRLITLLAMGAGMLFAALNVRFRDIRFRIAIPNSVLDVCDSCDLSGQPRSEKWQWCWL